MNLLAFPTKYKKYAVMAKNKNPGLQDVQYSVWNQLINPDVYLGNTQYTILKFYHLYPFYTHVHFSVHML